jgi:hypothetical protein
MVRTTPSTTRCRRLAVGTTVALSALTLAAPTAIAEHTPTVTTLCAPIVCAANYLEIPFEHLLVQLDEDARSSAAEPIDVLLARLDAVAAVRIGVVSRTDGPIQVAVIGCLIAQHRDVRLAVMVGATGEQLPGPIPG